MADVSSIGDRVLIREGADALELQWTREGWKLLRGRLAQDKPEALARIVLNGKSLEIRPMVFSYEELTRLAGENPARNPSFVFRLGDQAGTLIPGETLKVADGMKISVIVTGSS